jgi:vitamin B12 transporter
MFSVRSLRALGATVACSTITLFPFISSAQAITQLDSIVVTATRSPITRAQAMADIVVIDRKAIEQSGAQTVAQLLSVFAGVEIAETGGVAKTTGLFLRGTKTAQSLILLNGVKLENAGSGGGNLEFIPLNSIERIEVVQGPASAAYGSSAVGGVVQIFTRSDSPNLRLQASAGSFGSAQASINLGGPFKQGAVVSAGRWQASLGTSRSKGFDATLPTSSNAQLDRDGARQTNATVSTDFRLLDAVNLGFSLLKNQGHTDYDDSFSTPDSAKLKFSNGQVAAYATINPVQGWSSTLRLARSQIDYAYRAFDYSPKAITQMVQWENEAKLNPVASLVFGIDQDRQKVSGVGVEYQTDQRRSRAFWLGSTGAVGPHQWRLQARRDSIKSPVIGGAVAAPSAQLTANHYAAAYGFRLATNSVVSLSSATAFRAPTFDDLFSPFGGNPSLTAERSRNIELLLQQRSGAADWSLAAFSQTIRDAIELDADFSPQNQQQAKVRGLTGRLQWQFNLGSTAVALRANLTAQDPKSRSLQINQTTGFNQLGESTTLARRARVHGGLSADFSQGPISYFVSLRGQGKRVDSDLTPLGGYLLGDLRVNYLWQPGLNVFVKALNLTNKQYETAAGYRSQPRAFQIGFDWTAQ